MILVLVPGLDGTGEFFKPFLDVYGRQHTQVIPLPQSGPQDYARLTEHVLRHLPADRDYVVLAESFSGPIGAHLALQGLPRLKGVIFVATFLSPPPMWLTTLGLMLPLKTMVPTRAGAMVLRFLLAGPRATAEYLSWVQSVVGSVPADIINARIRAIRGMRRLQGSTMVPSLDLRALQDRMIPAGKFAEFRRHFRDIKLFKIDGPHLILPARAGDCAQIIRRMFPRLKK
jgi:pimeloyl-ACP methyl ester carboxylesterase